MRIIAELQKPYTEQERIDFIVNYNHKLGLVIKKTETSLQALGYTAEELQEQEKERVGKLTCTKRVFALMLQEMGIDYLTILLPLIESNPQAKLEWDLCVELERSNPLLDIMASQLGVTPKQLDGLFKYANGEITIDEFRALLVEEENESTTDIQENTEE